MRTSLCICAAAAALALGSVHASACDDGCGWGSWGYGSYYAPTAYGYYAPVAAFRGPRWDYSYDRYSTAPVVYGAPWGRYRPYRPYAEPGYHAGPRSYAGPRYPAGSRFYARTYRVYERGSDYRGWRRW
jgi:hypothetical protein